MSELRVVDLSFSYGDRVLLDRVSFTVPEGDAFVLLGPSASGKTTLFRLIAGFLRPQAGEIRLGGRIVSSRRLLVPPRERRVGMVFQSLALWPHLTAAGHLRLAGAGPRAASLLDDVGLAGDAGSRPDGLSGGQRQRLAIGRAVAGDPRVLLLDEPFSNLDPPYRHEVNVLLRKVWERAKPTVLFVTHHVEEIALPVAGYLLLEEGRVWGPRPLGELIAASESRYAQLMRAHLQRRGAAGV